jgi:hypothetical protein
VAFLFIKIIQIMLASQPNPATIAISKRDKVTDMFYTIGDGEEVEFTHYHHNEYVAKVCGENGLEAEYFVEVFVDRDGDTSYRVAGVPPVVLPDWWDLFVEWACEAELSADTYNGYEEW